MNLLFSYNNWNNPKNCVVQKARKPESPIDQNPNPKGILSLIPEPDRKPKLCAYLKPVKPEPESSFHKSARARRILSPTHHYKS